MAKPNLSLSTGLRRPGLDWTELHPPKHPHLHTAVVLLYNTDTSSTSTSTSTSSSTSTHLSGGEGHLLCVVVKQSAEVDEQTLGRLRSEEPHRRTLRPDRRLDTLLQKIDKTRYHTSTETEAEAEAEAEVYRQRPREKKRAEKTSTLSLVTVYVQERRLQNRNTQWGTSRHVYRYTWPPQRRVSAYNSAALVSYHSSGGTKYGTVIWDGT